MSGGLSALRVCQRPPHLERPGERRCPRGRVRRPRATHAATREHAAARRRLSPDRRSWRYARNCASPTSKPSSPTPRVRRVLKETEREAERQGPFLHRHGALLLGARRLIHAAERHPRRHRSFARRGACWPAHRQRAGPPPEGHFLRSSLEGGPRAAASGPAMRRRAFSRRLLGERRAASVPGAQG